MLVVSNNHVISAGENFIVIYAQGGTAEAELVGTAPEFDLAVLKVDGSVPATVGWGDSGELPLGSHVIAIGSARRYARRLDLPISGTLGVLALLVRDQLMTLPQADKLLQTMIQAGYHSPINSLAEIYDFRD